MQIFQTKFSSPFHIDGGEEIPPSSPPERGGGGRAPQEQEVYCSGLLWQKPPCSQVGIEDRPLRFFSSFLVRSGKGAVLDEVLARPMFCPESEDGNMSSIEGYIDPDRDTIFLHMK